MGTTIYSPLQKTTKKQSQHWRLNSQKNKKSYNLFISIFLIPQFDLSLCIKAFFLGGGRIFDFSSLSFCLRGECWISNRNHSVPTNRWRWPSEPLFRKDPQRSVSLSSLWIATLSRPSGLVVLFFSRSFLPFTSCSSFSLSSTRIRYFCFPSLCEMYFVFFHVLWDVFPTNTFILKSWLTCILVIWQKYL